MFARHGSRAFYGLFGVVRIEHDPDDGYGCATCLFLTEEMLAEAKRHYAGRPYHGWPHIEFMLELFVFYRRLVRDADVFEAMIVYHDIVYDSRRRDNERLSAVFAVAALAGRLSARRLGNVSDGIDSTAKHVPVERLAGDALADTELLCDMDLAILGTDPATFDAYDAAIREEYSWVPEADWRNGRAAVLRNFLDRKLIFKTPEFRERFEDQARVNLARAIAALES